MAESETPEISNVGDALESLVHQFADPWAFLREMVQNAIDAGTDRIDVRIDHDEARGSMIIEVADYGEGMTREIIDTRLTRLFSSSKEGDYTKIGRFGIGFVSVFAIDPEIVCVDTGRAGEWWRVVFRRDRTFERIKLSNPVEGTNVRLFKSADATAVAAARVKARETLEYWCKHARIDLQFEGETITRPLDVAGLCKVSHAEEGTSIVMAIVEHARALRGYYHSGLTLHEEYDDSLAHVAFKLDSRFLEHTLTRDNVIRDENYAKAMAIIGTVARTRLVSAMFEELEAMALERTGRSSERALLRRMVATQFATGVPDPSWLIRAIVPMIGEAPSSIEQLRGRRRGKLYRAKLDSPLVERLRAEGRGVIDCTSEDEVDNLVAAALGFRPIGVASLCTALRLAPDEEAQWLPLREAVKGMLARGRKWKVSEVAIGHLDYPESPIADRVAISQARFGELTPVEEIGELASGWLASGRCLVLNADHPTLRNLREVAQNEPELAGYLAVKSFFLHAELGSDLDLEMANSATEARWRRLGN